MTTKSIDTKPPAPKPADKAEALASKIAKAAEALKKLQAQQQQLMQKQNAANRKAVLEMLQTSKLDLIDKAIWQKALPAITALLTPKTAG